MDIGFVNIDKELCTGCQQCVEVCPVNAIQGKAGQPQEIDYDVCVSCGQCIQVCNSYAFENRENSYAIEEKRRARGLLESVKEPVFAAFNKGNTAKVKEALHNEELFTIVQCAPAIRVSLGEEFGLKAGSLTAGKMAAALRRLGFNRVYDTNFGADLTIMEEGSELIKRVTEGGKLPMFTSCCPAWVKFMEQSYPELLNHLSSCKSPQQMAGTIFKTYGAKIDKVDPKKIYNVAIMPCTCKQFECDREEMQDSGFKDVDIVITTREFAQLIRDKGIDFKNLKDEEFDLPLGSYTGAGNIFGVTGGVMEAALRSGYEMLTKKSIPNLELNFVRGSEGIRVAEVKLPKITLKVAVVSGLKNVVQILEDIKEGKCEFDFIEVMTCPEGCVSGGGQPKFILDIDRRNALVSRKKGIYKHDSELEIRKSHENPFIKKLYEEFLIEPLGEKSHHLLHTKFVSRKKEEI
ncbi:[FeFe] hydrogenase, group A [Clostridium diolis]|uniref:Iron hydrogenase n=1 Tax=Clostridium diolis TaxID=223919 RepID=A0AAV3W2G8_9CLOT|nr:[FeFe] hydrogenase, group A [Clostridium diolis]QES74844.1 4Fe-4S dicluster domain-containing protein [Clostridium diolis]GEA32131.1 iron hydrogenase [Clostridium diolis]